MAILQTPFTGNRNDLLRSERIAGGILPRILGSFDLVAIVVAVILWIPNAALVTGAGAAAYVYWILGFVTFLLPGAIVTGQLGLMFPGEGSIYVWTTKAFGSFMGFLAGFCAWWPGILAMMIAGDVVVSLIQQMGHLFGLNLLPDPGLQGFVIIAVLVLSYILSTLRFRITQNFINVAFIIYGGAVLLIGLAGVLWLVTGHAAGIDLSFRTGNWMPTRNNFTFYGTVILALLGIEVPLNMGVEIRDIRSITRYLLWGSVVVMVAYLIATFGVMVAAPLKDQGNPMAITEALQNGFGPAGSYIAAMIDLIFICFFIGITTVFNYSYGRLLFVSGLDRRLPAIISKVSTNKIPWVAMLVQTIIGISFTAIVFVLAPFSLKSVELATMIYAIFQAGVTVIWCVSMSILFLDVLIIRRKYRSAFARVRFVPDWMFYPCAVIGTLASITGIYVIFTAPWTASSASTSLTTMQWDVWLIGIVVISLIVAVVGFYIGRATIKSDLSDEEIIKEVTS